MTFDDRIGIRTPEGLEIELHLAGLGSRLVAALIDFVIVGIVLILAAFGMFGLADFLGSAMLAIGLGWLIMLLILLGYFVAFEVFADGRTPGKAMFSLRVLMDDGEPVGFGPSVVRNLLRLVDLFPALPILGPIAILVSDKNQRIGDMAARTIVVRDVRRHHDEPAEVALDPRAARWDVTAVAAQDMEVARRYLARRSQLSPDKREELVSGIASRLRARVPGIDDALDDDWVVEQVVAAKLSRGRG